MCAFICTQRVFLGPTIRCRMKVIKEGGGAVRKGGGAVRKEIKCNTMSAVRDAKPNGLTMGAVPGIYAF